MSAYIVSDKTISTVCQVAKNYKMILFDGLNQKRSTLAPGSNQYGPTEFGQDLIAMNYRAVNQRYNEEAESHHEHYRFKGVGIVEAMTQLKCLDCLIYQCSEGDVPSEPLYKHLLELQRKVMRSIILTLPDYDRAPWGFDD